MTGTTGTAHTAHPIKEEFLALPLRELADAALSRAAELGAEHADIRVEQVRGQDVRLRDGQLEGSNDSEDLGFAVRVVHDGTWGFAAAVDLTPEHAARAAEQAIDLARISRPLSTERVEMAAEPVHSDVRWVSSYEVDPMDVPDHEKISLLMDWSSRLLAAPGVNHVDASVYAVRENKFYADLAGTTTTQQRVRIHPEFRAVAVNPESGAFETMRTVAPPSGRGWEYATGTGWDWTPSLPHFPICSRNGWPHPRSSREHSTWWSTRRTSG